MITSANSHIIQGYRGAGTTEPRHSTTAGWNPTRFEGPSHSLGRALHEISESRIRETIALRITSDSVES
jgi:hypothetical protein